MIIKLGILGSEVDFNYVNVNSNTIVPKSEHGLISGEIKFQEAYNSHKVYSFEFVYLTYAKKVALEAIFVLSNILNVQLETELYGVDQSIQIINKKKMVRSRRIPSGYEATIEGVEV